MAQTVKNLPAMQETQVRSLSWEDSPGERNGYSLQNSCLENSMARGGWQTTVHGVAKNWTQLSNYYDKIYILFIVSGMGKFRSSFFRF